MDKIVFEQAPNNEELVQFQPKKEFFGDNMQIEPDVEKTNDSVLEQKFEGVVNPKTAWWKKCCGAAAVLLVLATMAQSIQWLLDTYRQNQWIYFVFALVSVVFVFVGMIAFVREWNRLYHLKKRENLKQRSQQFVVQDESAVGFSQDFEQGKQLCLMIADEMKLDENDPNFQRWQTQINEGYHAQEITYLFSQNVLQPLDKQAKKLISRTALESAVVVAISPLALVDMFFVAWRNLRLVNQLATLYGIELGYISRIRLLRLVLVNMAFAGVAELLQDIGMDWLSQDITAKLSARAAQGIGVGLLTARLGLKAMEFCRPLVFQQAEKPKLSVVYRELLTNMKQHIFSRESSQLKEKQPN